MKKKTRYHQQGSETLEFMFVAIFYFTLLFAIFEFSRGLYAWNVLNEATRRGARMATVCPYQSTIPFNVAVFNSRNDASSSSVLSGLSPANVNIRYLNSVGSVVNLTQAEIDAGGLIAIEFVEVTINYQHQMLFTNLFNLFVPNWTGTLNSPTFRTTLPIESLGADPTFTPPANDTTCDF